MPDKSHNHLVLRSEMLDSPMAEAYRTLRANISFRSIDQPVKSIVVTSASKGEGKTTTVVNMGIIMALAELNVLVVDADLRQGSMQQAISGLEGWTAPGPSHPGLTDVIVGAASLQGVLLRTPYERLSLVPAGRVPPNPSELLSSERMWQVLGELSAVADCVLIDTPPCLLYSDALLLAQMVDGVLYVVRSGGQNKAGQRRVQKQLHEAKARLLGVVFNEVELEEPARRYSSDNVNRQQARA